jgi:hypothetical protein
MNMSVTALSGQTELSWWSFVGGLHHDGVGFEAAALYLHFTFVRSRYRQVCEQRVVDTLLLMKEY